MLQAPGILKILGWSCLPKSFAAPTPRINQHSFSIAGKEPGIKNQHNEKTLFYSTVASGLL